MILLAKIQIVAQALLRFRDLLLRPERLRLLPCRSKAQGSGAKSDSAPASPAAGNGARLRQGLCMARKLHRNRVEKGASPLRAVFGRPPAVSWAQAGAPAGRWRTVMKRTAPGEPDEKRPNRSGLGLFSGKECGIFPKRIPMGARFRKSRPVPRQKAGSDPPADGWRPG